MLNKKDIKILNQQKTKNLCGLIACVKRKKDCKTCSVKYMTKHKFAISDFNWFYEPIKRKKTKIKVMLI
jgi:hypothetical protein